MLGAMIINGSMKISTKRIKRDGVTLWFAGNNPRTPWYSKALGVFVVAYALNPIDLIPDFIPLLGYVDDVLLLPGLIWLTIKLLPPEVLAECRVQADDWMQTKGAKPQAVESVPFSSPCCAWPSARRPGFGYGRAFKSPLSSAPMTLTARPTFASGQASRPASLQRARLAGATPMTGRQ